MFKMDMFNIAVGIIAQTVLVVVPLYLVLREYTSLLVSLAILFVCGILLKKYWWDRLDLQV